MIIKTIVSNYLSRPPKGWEWTRNVAVLIFVLAVGFIAADKVGTIELQPKIYSICQYIAVGGGILGLGAQTPKRKGKKSKKNSQKNI